MSVDPVDARLKLLKPQHRVRRATIPDPHWQREPLLEGEPVRLHAQRIVAGFPPPWPGIRYDVWVTVTSRTGREGRGWAMLLAGEPREGVEDTRELRIEVPPFRTRLRHGLCYRVTATPIDDGEAVATYAHFFLNATPPDVVVLGREVDVGLGTWKASLLYFKLGGASAERVADVGTSHHAELDEEFTLIPGTERPTVHDLMTVNDEGQPNARPWQFFVEVARRPVEPPGQIR